MDTINDQFKLEAKVLADLYHQRKHLAYEINTKEVRLRELGVILEFTDNLESNFSEAGIYDVECE